MPSLKTLTTAGSLALAVAVPMIAGVAHADPVSTKPATPAHPVVSAKPAPDCGSFDSFQLGEAYRGTSYRIDEQTGKPIPGSEMPATLTVPAAKNQFGTVTRDNGGRPETARLRYINPKTLQVATGHHELIDLTTTFTCHSTSRPGATTAIDTRVVFDHGDWKEIEAMRLISTVRDPR
jgi:hypothetical protein